jgi:hypothetical protein
MRRTLQKVGKKEGKTANQPRTDPSCPADHWITPARKADPRAHLQMLASSWLTGGVKSGAYARPAPYAQGSIIPGSNYSAQDNHDSLKVSGM